MEHSVLRAAILAGQEWLLFDYGKLSGSTGNRSEVAGSGHIWLLVGGARSRRRQLKGKEHITRLVSTPSQ